MNFNNIDKTFINISDQGDVPASHFYITANSAQHQDIIKVSIEIRLNRKIVITMPKSDKDRV